MSFRPGAPTSSILPATVSSSGTAAAALVPSDDEPPADDWDHQDPYAPRQPGLPLYTVNKDSAMSGSQDGTATRTGGGGGGGGVEVVDSSTARRRPQGQSPAAFVDSAADPFLLDRRDRHADYDDDEKKKEKESGKDGKEVWPVSGIGMEGRIPETRRDFLAKGGGGAATRPRREVAWVSPSPPTSILLFTGSETPSSFKIHLHSELTTLMPMRAERRRPRSPVRLAATSPSHHLHHPRALYSPLPPRSQPDRRLGRGQLFFSGSSEEGPLLLIRRRLRFT